MRYFFNFCNYTKAIISSKLAAASVHTPHGFPSLFFSLREKYSNIFDPVVRLARFMQHRILPWNLVFPCKVRNKEEWHNKSRHLIR